MSEIVIWALATGVVTGAAWASIILLRRRHPALPLADRQDRLESIEELDVLHDRLELLEERLDQAEYERARERLISGDDPGPESRS